MVIARNRTKKMRRLKRKKKLTSVKSVKMKKRMEEEGENVNGSSDAFSIYLFCVAEISISFVVPSYDIWSL
jgi:hypothetical protein